MFVITFVQTKLILFLSIIERHDNFLIEFDLAMKEFEIEYLYSIIYFNFKGLFRKQLSMCDFSQLSETTFRGNFQNRVSMRQTRPVYFTIVLFCTYPNDNYIAAYVRF